MSCQHALVHVAGRILRSAPLGGRVIVKGGILRSCWRLLCKKRSVDMLIG